MSQSHTLTTKSTSGLDLDELLCRDKNNSLSLEEFKALTDEARRKLKSLPATAQARNPFAPYLS